MKKKTGNGRNHSLLMIADLYIKFWGIKEMKNVKQRQGQGASRKGQRAWRRGRSAGGMACAAEGK
jgi:hypothetical protein